jgi:putative ABC transport system ATP-binding protein
MRDGAVLSDDRNKRPADAAAALAALPRPDEAAPEIAP